MSAFQGADDEDGEAVVALTEAVGLGLKCMAARQTGLAPGFEPQLRPIAHILRRFSASNGSFFL